MRTRLCLTRRPIPIWRRRCLFDSQIAGGKRYNGAALGRRLANAAFFASRDTGGCESVSYALDITPLVLDGTMSPSKFIARYIGRFAGEVASRILKLMEPSNIN